MASRVVMPKLTDTMTEGVLLKWYKKEGDAVESGDVLAEIETDKAVMDLEAYGSGILKRVLVKEGATVPAGDLLAIIAGKDEDISAAEFEKLPSFQQNLQKPDQNKRGTDPLRDERFVKGGSSKTAQQVKASPLAKKIAKEKGIDLLEIKGSGPGGRIVEKDLLNSVGMGKRERHGEVPSEIKPLSQMRKAIVRSMAQSKIPVPHFYVVSDIDMEKTCEFQTEMESRGNEKVSLTDILIKSCAIALTKTPQMNASFVEDHLEYHKEVRIGVAVGLEDGIITPVIKGCESKSLGQIAKETKPLFQRARERKLSPEEYTGATFSISNLGAYDVHHFIAIITPPEAGVLAVGSLRHEPVVQEGQIVVGKRMQVTLSCDHRVIDGVGGAKFLQELKKILENPGLLVL
ncbi:MAG: 2-oxo acid dehydrogenase subunit E2 [Nitrospirae bacterium]|nr:2-oxo acid dehydrogenase subunit E2 [Nitrospirota bacterium]